MSVGAPSEEYFEGVPGHMLAKTSAGNVATGLAWNYISIGMDAESAYKFHHLRETKPHLASGRMVNQMWYMMMSLKSGIFLNLIVWWHGYLWCTLTRILA